LIWQQSAVAYNRHPKKLKSGQPVSAAAGFHEERGEKAAFWAARPWFVRDFL